MIYTYIVSKDFIKELDEYNFKEVNKIIDFITTNFINEENIYNSGSRNLFSDGNYKNLRINDFLLSLSNDIGVMENKSKLGVDFSFLGKDEKCENVKIKCDDILTNKDLKTKTKDQTEDLWSNRKGVEDIQKKLNNLVKYSKCIFFVDRHVSIVLADKVHKQLFQWDKSLNFYKKILYGKNIKSFFYNGVNKKVFDKYMKKVLKIKPEEIAIEIEKYNELLQRRKDSHKKLNLKFDYSDKTELEKNEDAINLKGQEYLKKDLVDFFNKLKSLKTNVFVLNPETYRAAHDRFIFFFLDKNHALQTAFRDNTLVILEVSEGLNIIDAKGNTTLTRRIERKNRKSSQEIVYNWTKNIANKPLFYQFEVS